MLCFRLLTIKTITVRTKTSNNQTSKDSDPCIVPQHLRQQQPPQPPQQSQQQQQQQQLQQEQNRFLGRDTADEGDDDESDSDNELIEKLAKIPLNKPREVVINYSGYPELDSDIGPSELSDIAEEPEEGLTDTEDRDTPMNENAIGGYGHPKLGAGMPMYDR